MNTNTKRWSVEWIDNEGDSIVEHVDTTDDGMATILTEMASRGFNPTAHDLSAPSEPLRDDVLSFDERKSS